MSDEAKIQTMRPKLSLLLYNFLYLLITRRLQENQLAMASVHSNLYSSSLTKLMNKMELQLSYFCASCIATYITEHSVHCPL